VATSSTPVSQAAPVAAAEPNAGAVEPGNSGSSGTAEATKPGESAAANADDGGGSAAIPSQAAPSASRSAARGGGKIARRKHAARVAAEQQQTMPKQRGALAHAGKVAAKVTTTSDVAKAGAPAEQLAPTPAVPAEEAPVHATLSFKNEAGDTFKLAEARFTMDGAALPTVLKTVGRGQTERVFSGDIPPGRHVIASHIVYHGADRAVFSYMKGYTFKVQSDDTFVARGAEPVKMTIICKEKTGFNRPVEKRLTVTVEGESTQ
jgi:hypothetical protein